MERVKNIFNIGIFLILISLGGIFSSYLVEFSYFMLLLGTLLIWLGLNGKKHFLLTGSSIIVVFLGIQSPQIPFKPYLLLIGAALAAPYLIKSFNSKALFALGVFGTIFVAACTPGIPNLDITDSPEPLVDLDKIVGGGPPKDGIPSIDNPKFVTVEKADEWIDDNELVLAIIYKDVKRVYPLQIMVWHEIVNDNIAGDPILITYCPLCGSGIAYNRTLNGEEVEFGTSGKLYNSNLVMYDRKTDSYWSQIDGIAITGELTGTQLEGINIDTVVWRDWKNVHPDSEVLSQKTGFARNYGRDPYGSYYEDSFLIFPVDNSDDRVHPKTVVFGIEKAGKFIAYREEDVVNSTIDDVDNNVRVSRDEAGVIKIIDLETNLEIVKERGFWFAWYTFHPDTELYGVEPNE